jgi:hypothetical protein
VPDSRRPSEAHGGGLSLVVIVLALFVIVYLAFQIIGALFRLLFLVTAVVIAIGAWRAWRARA